MYVCVCFNRKTYNECRDFGQKSVAFKWKSRARWVWQFGWQHRMYALMTFDKSWEEQQWKQFIFYGHFSSDQIIISFIFFPLDLFSILQWIIFFRYNWIWVDNKIMTSALQSVSILTWFLEHLWEKKLIVSIVAFRLKIDEMHWILLLIQWRTWKSQL